MSIRNLRPRFIIQSTLFGLALVCLLLGIWALAFWRDPPPEARASLIIAGSLGLFACLIALAFTRSVWKLLRRRAWVQTVTALQDAPPNPKTPGFQLSGHASEALLRQMAVQNYTRMGYLVRRLDTPCDLIILRNPDGQTELVACKLHPSPLQIRDIGPLLTTLAHHKAAGCHVWAPQGFTPETLQWAKSKPLTLIDRHGIERLVDCVQAKGSTLLEK